MPLSPEARKALESMNRRPLRHKEQAPQAPPAGEGAAGAGAEASAPLPAASPTAGDAAASPAAGARPSPARTSASGGYEPAPWPPRPSAAAGVPSQGVKLPDIPAGEPPLLERLIQGVTAECRGRACFVHQRVVQTPSWREVPIARMLLDAYARGCDDAGHPLAPLLQADPEDLLLLDIESCGLGGAPLFLIGVLYLEGGALHARQFFARDYTEEPGVLEHARDLIEQRRVLATFNGKSFDLPYIADRCAYHRLGAPRPGHHIDVLHLARKRWRSRLPDCRLQTLERHLCRRHRIDDIPGDKMAQAYHDFVRTGDASDMRKVFHHNLMDLVTMAEVLCALAPG